MVSIDYTSELTKVSNAIEKILDGGQEVWYLNRRVTRADLGELRKHRDDLIQKIGKQSRGGIRIRKGVPE